MNDKYYIKALNENGFFANFNSLPEAEKNIVNVLSNKHYLNSEGYSPLSYVSSYVDFDNPAQAFYIAKNDEKYQHQKLYFLYTDKGIGFVGDRYFLIDSFYPYDDSRIVKFYDGSWDQSQIVEDIKQYIAKNCSADAIEKDSHFYISKNCQKWSPEYGPEFVVGSDKIREML